MRGISHLMILVEGRQLPPLDRKPCFLNIPAGRKRLRLHQAGYHMLDSSLGHGATERLEVFGIVNKGEVDVFLELSCFFYDPTDVGILISGSSAFSKSSLYIWKF